MTEVIVKNQSGVLSIADINDNKITSQGQHGTRITWTSYQPGKIHNWETPVSNTKVIQASSDTIFLLDDQNALSQAFRNHFANRAQQPLWAIYKHHERLIQKTNERTDCIHQHSAAD